MKSDDENISNAKKASPQSLLSELDGAINKAVPWANRASIAEDAFYCWWAGQSDDGRKRKRDGEPTPWPWDGASDTRVRLVEEKIRELCAVCESAWTRGKWEFAGVDGFDFIKAGKFNQLLKWQIKTQMGRNAERQRKLATKYMFMYGLAIIAVSWSKKERLGLIDIAPIDLARKFGIEKEWLAYTQNPMIFSGQFAPETLAKAQLVVDLDTLLYAPITEEYNPEKSLALWLGEFYPDANDAACLVAAKSLREKQTAQIPQKRVVKECPAWSAFLPFENIFFPTETEDLSEARWIALRKWLTRTDVESNAEWPKNFKEELLKHEGQSSTKVLEGLRKNSERWKRSQRADSEFVRSTDNTGLYEIYEFYYRATDERGLEQLKKCVFSEHVKGENGEYILAEDGIYDENGDYPFVALEINPDGDCLIDNYGIPYALYTHQMEVKEARDARINAKDINILPPVVRDVRDMGRPFQLGPDVPVYESVRGSTQWMKTPDSKTYLATEIENTVKIDIDRYCGTSNAGVPDNVTQAIQSYILSGYLSAMGELLTRTFQLDQLYLPETVVTRVSGIIDKPFKISREEISGQFDVYITFDPREMDSQVAVEKAKQLVEIIQLDRNGIIDINKAVSLAVSMVDPLWAEKLITDAQKGALKEISDEQNNVSLIMTGQEPPMREDEPSAGMRLQYLQNLLAKSPEVQGKIATNPFVKSLFENRVKHLQFALMQQRNAQTGKLGVNPIMKA